LRIAAPNLPKANRTPIARLRRAMRNVMAFSEKCPIIWGIKAIGARRGNPKQKGVSDMRLRARILLELLEAEQQAILFPTIALAEVLIRVDENVQQQFIATIQEKFYCPPFNLPASALAAKLWLSNHKLPEPEQITRQTLKADVQIIATAAVH